MNCGVVRVGEESSRLVLVRTTTPILSLAVLLSILLGCVLCAKGGDVAIVEERDWKNGVDALHVFDYETAARIFRAAQKKHRTWAMGYVGEAFSFVHLLSGQESVIGCRETLRRLQEATQIDSALGRESMYVSAIRGLCGDGTHRERVLSFVRSLERLMARFPTDYDAAAFYGLALLDLGLDNIESAEKDRLQSLAVFKRVLMAVPDHVGALHYAIHACDGVRQTAECLAFAEHLEGLRLPNAHAQHMPSHIYYRQGLWTRGIAANRRAWRLSRNTADGGTRRDSEGFHALYWVEYGLLQQGRYDEAKEVLDQMQQVSRADGKNGGCGVLVEAVTSYLVEAEPDTLVAVQDECFETLTQRARRIFAVGLQAARLGDRKQVLASNAEFAEILEPKVANQENESNEASQRAFMVMKDILMSLVLLGDGQMADSLSALQAAVIRETELPIVAGPPTIPKPAGELLGEILLELRRPGDARVVFDSVLRRQPGRHRAEEGAKLCLVRPPTVAKEDSVIRRWTRGFEFDPR